MGLALINGECNTGIPTIATDLTVASVELLADNAVRIWFTLPPIKGGLWATDTNGYRFTGPSTIDMSMASETSVSDRAIDLYFTQNLYPGQWTISFIRSYFKYGDIFIVADTQYRFDIVKLDVQEAPGLPTESNLTRKFINPAFRGKTNWEAVIDSLEAGRVILDDTAQKAFRQAFISSASGKYLGTRAADNGISKPTELGLTDEIYRDLAITILNRKLSKNAYLELLEIIYGVEATHASITSSRYEPYQLFDKISLTFVVDGVELPIVFDWTDFYNASIATAQEVCQALNARFERFNSKAFAVPFYDKILDKTYVRVYSGSLGLESSISIIGGTAQPIFHFGGSLFSTFPDDY